MNPHAFPRRLAMSLLQSAISIAPDDTQDWGHAMLAELHHVSGDWSALLWSLGSVTVLAKRALLALIFPSQNRLAVPSAGDLFAKEGPMRKSALAVTAACVVASLLFFIAPVFRQAFSISLLQWEVFFERDYSRIDPEVESIAHKAEQNHDAEALTFVAFHLPVFGRPDLVARLADEAVHLDPNLTWVYAVVGVRWPDLPQIDRWVPILEKYDPQNALFPLIAAEKIDLDQIDRRQIPHSAEDRLAAWRDAMAAAFRSSKLDTYSGRVNELERHVLLRYDVRNPFLTPDDARFYGLPSYGISDSSSYAEMVLKSAQVHEREGDLEGASEEYLAVVHFVYVVTPDMRFRFAAETQKAYTRLSAIAAKSRRPAEAAFYASLADSARKANQPDSSWLSRFRGDRVARWDADLAKGSGVAMLLSAALLLATVFAVVLRSLSLRLFSLQPGRLAVVLGVSSSAALFVSSVVLRLTYQPYAEIFQRFVRDGDETDLPNLYNFLSHAYAPIGSEWLTPQQDYAVHFWSAVIILCGLALLVAIFRYLQTRLRPTPAV